MSQRGSRELPEPDGAEQSSAAERDVGNDDDGAEEADSSIMECPICLQPCVNAVKLPCSHVFCFLCVKGVMGHGRRACSLCRADVPASFLLAPTLLNTEEVTQTCAPEGPVEGRYLWYYEGRRGWWQYDERAAAELEEKYQSGSTRFEIMISGFSYVVDLDEGIQYRRQYPTRCRRVKRDVVGIPDKCGVAGIVCRPVPRGAANEPPSRSGGDGGEIEENSGAHNSTTSVRNSVIDSGRANPSVVAGPQQNSRVNAGSMAASTVAVSSLSSSSGTSSLSSSSVRSSNPRAVGDSAAGSSPSLPAVQSVIRSQPANQSVIRSQPAARSASVAASASDSATRASGITGAEAAELLSWLDRSSSNNNATSAAESNAADENQAALELLSRLNALELEQDLEREENVDGVEDERQIPPVIQASGNSLRLVMGNSSDVNSQRNSTDVNSQRNLSNVNSQRSVMGNSNEENRSTESGESANNSLEYVSYL